MAEMTAEALLPRGVTVANEDGKTLWVDRTILLDILESAITREGELLAEMKEWPEIWDEDLPDAEESARTNQFHAIELREFLEESK